MSGPDTAEGALRPGPAIVFPSVFLAVAAAVNFLLLRAHGPAWAFAAGPLAGAAVGLAAARAAEPLAARCSRRDMAAALVVVAAAGLWMWRLFGAGGALPIGDPIAVPQFARSLAAGRLLVEAFPPGSSGHAYPPGYPVLFAPAEAMLRPDQALLLFKLATVAVVTLIPAAWAELHRNLFAPRTPAWLTTGAAYAAFIVAERSLGFLTPFAGKNAVHLGLLLFPGVALATLALARTRRLWPLAAIPLYGLFLIHYSMLHLTAGVLGAYAVVGQRWRLTEVVKVAVAGGIGALLLVASNAEALTDPRAASLAWAPIEGLRRAAGLLLAERPELVIFHDAPFGLAASPYRLLQLGLCAAVAVGVAIRLREPGPARAAAVYGLALLVGILFGYGVVPAGITFDFVRSYAWTLEAALFLTAGLALAQLWRSWPPSAPARWLGAIAAAAAALALFPMVLNDARVERGVFLARAIPRSEVLSMDRLLPDRGPCYLIGHSEARTDVLVTVQQAPIWNYAETVSPCLYLNGSWVHPGAPGGRELDGLPSPAVLKGLPRGAPVYFVGPEARLAAYDARLRARGLDGRWRPTAQPVAGSRVWLATF